MKRAGGVLALALMALMGAALAAATLEKPGGVAVSGGVKGYADTVKGEKFTVYVWATGLGQIKIRIYNSRGVEVRELNKATSGGFADSIEWDGTNSSGKFLPSGVYPALVKAPGVRARISLVILRK